MPTTCGLPSSASRAMKQQILLEPTSTAAISPFFVTIRGFFIGSPPNLSSMRVARIFLVSCLVALHRRRRIGRRLRMALAHDDAIRLPEIDRGHVLVQEVVLAVE